MVYRLHLNYEYDYGDGWLVKITRPKVYKEDIMGVASSGKPKCVDLDGLSLMDDVGGIHAYVDFLDTIHNGNPEEREDLREWARFMGWTGRLCKAERLV